MERASGDGGDVGDADGRAGANLDGVYASEVAGRHGGGTKRHGRGCPNRDTRATSATALFTWEWTAGSEPRSAKLFQIQVHCSRRVLGPLVTALRRELMALANESEAGHDGCDGHETDTQGADTRLPRVENGGTAALRGGRRHLHVRHLACPMRARSCNVRDCNFMTGSRPSPAGFPAGSRTVS